MSEYTGGSAEDFVSGLKSEMSGEPAPSTERQTPETPVVDANGRPHSPDNGQYVQATPEDGASVGETAETSTPAAGDSSSPEGEGDTNLTPAQEAAQRMIELSGIGEVSEDEVKEAVEFRAQARLGETTLQQMAKSFESDVKAFEAQKAELEAKVNQSSSAEQEAQAIIEAAKRDPEGFAHFMSSGMFGDDSGQGYSQPQATSGQPLTAETVAEIVKNQLGEFTKTQMTAQANAKMETDVSNAINQMVTDKTFLGSADLARELIENKVNSLKQSGAINSNQSPADVHEAVKAVVMSYRAKMKGAVVPNPVSAQKPNPGAQLPRPPGSPVTPNLQPPEKFNPGAGNHKDFASGLLAELRAQG